MTKAAFWTNAQSLLLFVFMAMEEKEKEEEDKNIEKAFTLWKAC